MQLLSWDSMPVNGIFPFWVLSLLGEFVEYCVDIYMYHAVYIMCAMTVYIRDVHEINIQTLEKGNAKTYKSNPEL